MFVRIFDYLVSLLAGLLCGLGIRSRSDSSTSAGPDTEAGPKCVITENTGLLSQPEDNEREFLTGPDPPSVWYD